MKTIIKTLFVLSILWIVAVGTVSALNVSSTSVGSNYITWGWDNPSNTTGMYVDGYLMCGYESTIPSVNILGLTPGSCHNISVTIDPNDTAENVACTNYLAASGGGGQSSGNTDTGMGLGTNAIIFGLIGALIGGVVVLGRFLNKE